jgi:hypothetical protein
LGTGFQVCSGFRTAQQPGAHRFRFFFGVVSLLPVPMLVTLQLFARPSSPLQALEKAAQG